MARKKTQSRDTASLVAAFRQAWNELRQESSTGVVCAGLEILEKCVAEALTGENKVSDRIQLIRRSA
ncbi:MAG: hypothetical protein LBU79_06580 [Planctomycetota bacterium]|nr:hypothetical protein [Planctomycetota bacterium]